MKYFNWRDEQISQFVLGTAQLGMDYGISNETGKPTPSEAESILSTAIKSGVNVIDTAQVYGNSEQVIGEWIKKYKNNDIKVISKWANQINFKDYEKLYDATLKSQKNINSDLWGMMIHEESCLDQWPEISENLKKLKDKHLFRYLGVSLYSVDAAKKALTIPEIDFIQVPCNIWDQRMVDSNIFELAKENDKLCFVRSIFLQGLIIMEKTKAIQTYPIAKNMILNFDKICNELNVSKKDLALQYGKHLNIPLVIGLINKKQLETNLHSLINNNLNSDLFSIIKQNIKPTITDKIINPSKWGIKK